MSFDNALLFPTKCPAPSNPQEWKHRWGAHHLFHQFHCGFQQDSAGGRAEQPHTQHWDTSAGVTPPNARLPPRKCEFANHAPGTGGHVEREISSPNSCQAGARSLTPTFLFLSFFFFLGLLTAACVLEACHQKTHRWDLPDHEKAFAASERMLGFFP